MVGVTLFTQSIELSSGSVQLFVTALLGLLNTTLIFKTEQFVPQLCFINNLE